MKKVDIVRDYLDKFPEMPNRTLARKITEEYPELYSSIDNCRTAIRACKGQTKSGYKETHIQEKGENAINANMGNPYTHTTEKRTSPARVLVFDIETAPMRSYTWGMWKQNVGINQIISDWFCISWSAKWLFEESVLSDVLKPSEVRKENDKRIMKSIWALINEADVVIAHNGNKFDLRKLKTRFLKHGLGKPSPYQSIDTLLHARKQFAISSNRLDYLGEFLGLGRKLETGGFELWDSCMSGDKEALERMVTYCNQDVLLLESVYLALRAWISPHPNIGLYVKENVDSCPTCGSSNLKLESTYETPVNSYDALKCSDCGAWSRSRRTNTPLKENEGIKSSLP